MNVKDASGRLARWALLLQQYDFNIVHRPGRIHGNADCLSRRPYDSCEISSLKKEEPQTPHTQEMQRRDPELATMIDFLKNDIQKKKNDVLPTNDKDARKIDGVMRVNLFLRLLSQLQYVLIILPVLISA